MHSERTISADVLAKLPLMNPITVIAGCCADAAGGQAMVEPAITLMKSRRRIAFLKAQDYADYGFITAGIYDRRNGVQRSSAQQQF